VNQLKVFVLIQNLGSDRQFSIENKALVFIQNFNSDSQFVVEFAFRRVNSPLSFNPRGNLKAYLSLEGMVHLYRNKAVHAANFFVIILLGPENGQTQRRSTSGINTQLRAMIIFISLFKSNFPCLSSCASDFTPSPTTPSARDRDFLQTKAMHFLDRKNVSGLDLFLHPLFSSDDCRCKRFSICCWLRGISSP
jgi:hypothetical protein